MPLRSFPLAVAGFTLIESVLVLVLVAAGIGAVSSAAAGKADARETVAKRWSELEGRAQTPGQRMLLGWLRDECVLPTSLSDQAGALAWQSHCIRRQVLALAVRQQEPAVVRADLAQMGLDPAYLAQDSPGR